jgi:RimJ/RimL family protein N-acetyltransferase
MQWLLGPKDNAFIASLGGFPQLRSDEALLENAYTPPEYRGLGIMPAAMAEIAEHAVEFSSRYVLTFVQTDNIASLKGCQRAGFTPHLMHARRQFGYGLVSKDHFEPLPETDAGHPMKF